MQKQLEPALASQPHWLNTVEIIAAIGSVGGSIASVVINQAALASIPLSLTIALNLANRRRLLNQMEQGHQAAIAQLTHSGENHQKLIERLTEQGKNDRIVITQLVEQGKAHQTSLEVLTMKLAENQKTLTAELDKRTQELQDSTQALDLKQQQIQEFTERLHTIETRSRAIQANVNAAEAHFERGAIHQQLGDLEVALEDYTTAIRLNPNHADAYYNRGLIRSQIEERQKAIADLRAATNLYFDQGDLANYEKAKDLAKQIHALSGGSMDDESFEVPEKSKMLKPKVSEAVEACQGVVEPSKISDFLEVYQTSNGLSTSKILKESSENSEDSEALLVGSLFA
jgi:tetratricopeptide (TPR) repeat protein